MTGAEIIERFFQQILRGDFSADTPADLNLALHAQEKVREFMVNDAGQYAIQVLERKIESLTAARDSVKEDGFSSDTFVNWHQDGMIAGLQIAIDALRLEIPFVKLERGPLVIKGE